mgnify:CR=1 FL=1
MKTTGILKETSGIVYKISDSVPDAEIQDVYNQIAKALNIDW